MIVYFYCCLDVLHLGHILALKNAKSFTGKSGLLIVGLVTDNAIKERKKDPLLSFKERLIIASSIKYINTIIPQETYSPINNIKIIKPDILIESSDHKKKDILIHKDIVKSWGGRVVTLPYYYEQSSTEIKKKFIL